MTLKKIIQKSTIELENAGINTASLDVRVLLEHVLETDSSYIFSHLEMPITNSQYSKFMRLLKRRKKAEPTAYLTGHKEFFGYDFFVNKNVLIPRPETELIVEQVIEFIKCYCDESKNKQSRLPQPNPPAGGRFRNDRKKSINILDLGTGSGCIIISLALEALKGPLSERAKSHKPERGSCQRGLETNYYGSDISKKALYVARKNAKLHQVTDEIKFYHSNLFANKKMPKKYDIILANLPYVSEKWKVDNKNDANGICFEPKEAIFAKDNGTKIIEQFLFQAKEKINPNGLILIEADHRNAKEIKNLACKIFAKASIVLIQDLAKLDRVIKISF